MILKKRQAKVSKRGLYLQDKELRNTAFEPGQAIRFIIDPKNRSLVIQPAENPASENHVSKRQISDGVKPVIDIRCQAAKELFQGSDYLQVTIYSDRVLIEGFVENGDISSAEEQSRESDGILSIAQLTSVRKTSEIMISIRGLEQLVDHCRTDLNRKEYEIPLKFASLFSGAGLLDIGFLQNGFHCVYAIEIDRCAAENYRSNLEADQVICGDVNELQNLPEAPVIIAGPPCQDLSQVNSRRFLESSRNRLIQRYVELVGSSNCKVFVLENVPQIITTGRFKEEILEALGDQFDVNYGVLDAADMGTPQHRKRAFFIGSKIGPIALPKPVVSAYKTVREAFRGLTSNTPNQQNITRSSPKVLERLQQIRPGGNFSDAPNQSMKQGDHYSNYCKRLDYDRPSVAIVNYRKTMIIHPNEDRILSVREAARLQGVPDDYIFSGPLGQMQQQVANGVPVPLAFQIGKAIRKAIENYNNARLNYELC